MKASLLLVIIALTNFALPALAADAAAAHDMSKMSMSPNKEDREKMAKAHEQMATCLRSDQQFKSCHEALRTECKSLMGASCSGMDMEKGMHKDMKHK